MHRTQVLLKDGQYAALKTWSRRTDKGLSELIRLAVDRLLCLDVNPKRPSQLKAMCGIGKDPEGPSGREHDRILYNTPL